MSEAREVTQITTTLGNDRVLLTLDDGSEIVLRVARVNVEHDHITLQDGRRVHAGSTVEITIEHTT